MAFEAEGLWAHKMKRTDEIRLVKVKHPIYHSIEESLVSPDGMLCLVGNDDRRHRKATQKSAKDRGIRYF